MASGEYPRAATETSIHDRVTRIEMRLENGQKEFVGLREDLRSIRSDLVLTRETLAPKPLTPGQIFGRLVAPLMAAAIFVGGLVWQAARYPDRTEFEQLRDEAASSGRDLDARLNRLDAAQALQAKDLQLITASAARNETNLDRVVEKLDRLIGATKGK